MSHHATSCHVLPLMSRHATSCHVMSRHATSCHVVSRHVTSCHVLPCHVQPRHVTSCHVMSRLVTSRHVVSRHATSLHVTSCHVMSRPVTSMARWLSRWVPIPYRISGILSSINEYTTQVASPVQSLNCRCAVAISRLLSGVVYSRMKANHLACNVFYLFFFIFF